jgi:hypothetical protein
MISCTYNDTDATWLAVQKQAARLSGLPGFAQMDPAGKRELCMALCTANSLEDAAFVVDSVLESDTTEWCPSPPDLRRLIAAEQNRGRATADEIRQDWERDASGRRCPECQDFGIRESTKAADINSLASYCSCEAGLKRTAWRSDLCSPEIVNRVRIQLRRGDAPFRQLPTPRIADRRASEALLGGVGV